jgi:FkbM family methyltransferase
MYLIHFLERYVAERYLGNRRAYFLNNYPQVACFSFDHVSQFIITRGRYEQEELKSLQELVFPKLTNKRYCLDIGANIGNHSLFFSNYFEKIISFEPNPKTFKVLCLNTEDVLNIDAKNIGASDSKRQVKAQLNSSNIGATKIVSAGQMSKSNEKGYIQFNVDRLDDYLPETILSQIDFIKIDVEGHELSALSGLKSTLKNFDPVIAFESLAEDFIDGENPTIDTLKSYGYINFYEFARNDRSIFNAKLQIIEKKLRLVLKEQQYCLRKIDVFKVKNYNMIIASKAVIE